MTTSWPVSPWRRAFREERCLPAAVFGPVECWALAWLISVRVGVISFNRMGAGLVGVGWKCEVVEGVGVLGWEKRVTQGGHGIQSARSVSTGLIRAARLDGKNAAASDASATIAAPDA